MQAKIAEMAARVPITVITGSTKHHGHKYAALLLQLGITSSDVSQA
jgi:hypothetical protein